ncbi:cyclopropane-fatty-acyl-phospholipid synthase family protein [Jatrophihabitans lederbergiae]|uniref:Cyclopropane-fatty-acyl-phospholipid synthase family protein n=1 Tax=Jatrophihabitans lederbergiae TaxID=3075547 RepID=A0ABU2JD90_9ACTN|nr:cyclopropane-fatty-acyl-phospholipid synthase family protein [Jatrophihabitans sp. DSM 44399]MDT0262949.1 cyclopropane-fatty-acyl-phospholipid synthase family protein [Jatrophihabitans sp. DSM 44399]
MSVAAKLSALMTPLVGTELPVRIHAWDGSEAGPANAPVLRITSRRALRRLLWQPDELGIAQAYITGEIDVPGGSRELADGLRTVWEKSRTTGSGPITLTARQKLSAATLALRLGALGPRPTVPASQAKLTGTLHTRARDRAAIAHHYDLSNEFYSLILDESMAYSSAYYETDDLTLAQAQRAKLDLICRKLGLLPGMRLLDVGCGWGSLSLHAAEHYGVRVLGVTISGQQHEFIGKRIAERGLSDRVEVRVQDYREVAEQPFDAVSSIEMGEHVGEHNYPVYAGALFSHVKPTGRLLLQQMSRRSDAAPGGGPFIESYIAPDMHMRPLSETLGFLERAGFEIRNVQALREHYVRTVDAWLETFESHYSEAVAMVGDEMARVWRLYLVGGGLSFEEGRMGVDQILAVRPSPSGTSHLPPTPDWITAG